LEESQDSGPGEDGSPGGLTVFQRINFSKLRNSPHPQAGNHEK